MSLFRYAGGAGVGAFPQELWVYGINRSGARVAGDVMMFDITKGQETANFTLGDELSVLNNWVLPSTAMLGHGIFAVCGEDIADNAKGRMWIAHPDILVTAVDAVALTELMTAANASDTLAVATVAGAKVIGIPHTVGAANAQYWFNGAEGFGSEPG